jgi:hypothetical protein
MRREHVEETNFGRAAGWRRAQPNVETGTLITVFEQNGTLHSGTVSPTASAVVAKVDSS